MGNEAIWAERVAAWQGSGLTSEGFAAGRGFTGSGLRYWAHRLRREAAAAHTPTRGVRLARVLRSAVPTVEAAPTTMVRADVAPEESPVVLELGGARIAVQRGFDRATLAAVLEVVAGLARGAA